MKKKHLQIKLGILKYLLILPLFLLAFCQSEFEEPIGATENKAPIDSKLLWLMKSAIKSDSDQVLTQNKSDLSKSTSEDNGQCTNFLYPMTFQVYSGDDMIPVAREINSDEELIAFIEEFTFENSAGVYSPNYEMFLYFPIVLLDTDGNETVLNNLTELEGTLEMAVQACESFNNGSDGSSGDGSNDGADSGSGDGTSSDGSEGSSDEGSNEGSDEGSNAGSSDGSSDGSDGSSGADATDDSSGDDATDGSDGGSSDASEDSSDEGSSDGSDDGSSNSSDDSSEEGSDQTSESESGNDSEGDNFVETSHGDHEDDNGYKFCDKNNKKVYICHKGITICVSVNAIWGHLQHHEEDFLGTCDD